MGGRRRRRKGAKIWAQKKRAQKLNITGSQKKTEFVCYAVLIRKSNRDRRGSRADLECVYIGRETEEARVYRAFMLLLMYVGWGRSSPSMGKSETNEPMRTISVYSSTLNEGSLRDYWRTCLRAQGLLV